MTAPKRIYVAGRALTLAGPEPASIRDLDRLVPPVRAKAEQVRALFAGKGLDALVTDTLRLPERQPWLYALGRTTYHRDGRGKKGVPVTKVASPWASWHAYGVAFDVVDRTVRWNERHRLWGVYTAAMALAAETFGLRWGADWNANGRTDDERFLDWPHLQDERVPVSPTRQDQADAAAGNVAAVLARYGIR